MVDIDDSTYLSSASHQDEGITASTLALNHLMGLTRVSHSRKALIAGRCRRTCAACNAVFDGTGCIDGKTDRETAARKIAR
jgi:hypothetical protein